MTKLFWLDFCYKSHLAPQQSESTPTCLALTANTEYWSLHLFRNLRNHLALHKQVSCFTLFYLTLAGTSAKGQLRPWGAWLHPNQKDLSVHRGHSQVQPQDWEAMWGEESDLWWQESLHIDRDGKRCKIRHDEWLRQQAFCIEEDGMKDV